jgi:hypothetical protein
MAAPSSSSARRWSSPSSPCSATSCAAHSPRREVTCPRPSRQVVDRGADRTPAAFQSSRAPRRGETVRRVPDRGRPWTSMVRGESIWDRFCATPARRQSATRRARLRALSRWESDLDLMADLGTARATASRLPGRGCSPRRGAANASALEFYRGWPRGSWSAGSSDRHPVSLGLAAGQLQDGAAGACATPRALCRVRGLVAASSVTRCRSGSPTTAMVVAFLGHAYGTKAPGSPPLAHGLSRRAPPAALARPGAAACARSWAALPVRHRAQTCIRSTPRPCDADRDRRALDDAT